MTPLSDGYKPKNKKEATFLAAAEKSQKMPSTENRAKAQRAYDALPANSPLRKTKFEGGYGRLNS